MTPFDLLKIILGTWYIAHAVTATHGPGGVFDWVREKLPHGRLGQKFIVASRDPVSGEMRQVNEVEFPRNGLLDCIVCFAPYVALALLIAPVGVIADALAVAGGALLLHSFTGWRFTN